MVSSNFSGFQDGNYFWNGAQVTYERYRYEATRQQEAVLKHVNDIMTSEATQAVAPGAAMDQQAFGGLLRAVVPTLLDKYGKINATAAVQFYDQMRTTWLAANGEQARQQASRGNVRLQADRYAKARTKSAVAAAQGYVAQYADDYKTAERTDAVVNWAMKVRAKHGHQPSVDAMANAMTREVGAYHRDTVVFNAGLDPYVRKVQRVAQASACEFCRLMALGSTNGTVRTSNYAVHFHAHCHCTIQPLFDGEAPVRPDYYDQFEAEYLKAKHEFNGTNAGFKQTLENWRAINSGKTSPVVLTKPTKSFNTLDDLIADADNWRHLVTPGVSQQGGDQLLTYLIKKQNFNGKPELVSSLNELGNDTMFRGIADMKDGTPATKLVEAFKTAEVHHQGFGIYGNGTYFAKNPDVALLYASSKDSKSVASNPGVITAGVKDSANVMKFVDQAAYNKWWEDSHAAWQDAVSKAGLAADDPVARLPYSEQATSAWAAAQGIDAFFIGGIDYWVVLNRGALKVLK